MVAFTLFICLIQIQNTEICTVYRKPAKTILRYEFLLILPSPTLKKPAFGNIALDAPSCGLRREAKKKKSNSNFDNILVKNSNLVFQPI